MYQSIEHGLNAIPVTPSDATDLVRPSQGSLVANAGAGRFGLNVACALAVTVAGNVSFIDDLGNTQTISLTPGSQFFMRVTRVRATGTTATGISAYFPINL